MSATSVGSGHPPSGNSPKRGGSQHRGTPPDRRPYRTSPDEQTPKGNGSGGIDHNGSAGSAQQSRHALHQYQQHQQHHHQHQQHQGPSGITAQLTSPIGRRQRRKSTFEPRLMPHPHNDTHSAAVTPGAFMSPLAQLFTPIATEPPNGGFGALLGDHSHSQTHLGQRRASRRSGGDGQLGPGVNMFRRRVISGMPGHGQGQGQSGSTGTSALSTTPKDDSSQDPSETVSISGCDLCHSSDEDVRLERWRTKRRTGRPCHLG